jgi:glutamyl-tRNA synthetase
VGNVRTALLAWLAARLGGGTFVMRIEDLDAARVVPGAEAATLEDLAWLGLDWDEGPDRGGPHAPYRQSARADAYDVAIERLLSAGRAFPCACSRAEITRAASAPHDEHDEGPRYPGTCRGRPAGEIEARAREQGRAPAIRFDGRAESMSFTDEVHGLVDPLAGTGIDAFVLRRADGVAAYQLAVVVDDAAMGIEEVVRADDLLRSTPRQLALFRALGLRPPAYAHVPLLLSPGGERIAKRTRPPAVAQLRAAGSDPSAVVGRLAASAGLAADGDAITCRELLARLGTRESLWSRLTRAPTSWI